jgi:hypothetical protein
MPLTLDTPTTANTTSVYSDPTYGPAYKACRVAYAEKRDKTNPHTQNTPAWQGWEDAAQDAQNAHSDAVRQSSAF